MNKSFSEILRSCSVAIGALLGMAAVTPVLGASLNMPFDLDFSPRNFVLGGLLLLLIVALVVSLVKGHPRDEPHSEAPDMRWWKNHSV